MKVGFLGPRGSFSHTAVKKLAPESTTVEFLNFEDLFKAVSEKKIEYA
ncbi:MAG: prephenate dehydratase domain-containing protein, partial [Gammaproteobacteria bacterium]